MLMALTACACLRLASVGPHHLFLRSAHYAEHGGAGGADPGGPVDISAALHLGIDYDLLHATSKICAIQDADNAFFINFATFEGASCALQATGSRSLLFQGSVLLANVARNAMFINKLIC